MATKNTVAPAVKTGDIIQYNGDNVTNITEDNSLVYPIYFSVSAGPAPTPTEEEPEVAEPGDEDSDLPAYLQATLEITETAEITEITEVEEIQV